MNCINLINNIERKTIDEWLSILGFQRSNKITIFSITLDMLKHIWVKSYQSKRVLHNLLLFWFQTIHFLIRYICSKICFHAVEATLGLLQLKKSILFFKYFALISLTQILSGYIIIFHHCLAKKTALTTSLLFIPSPPP